MAKKTKTWVARWFVTSFSGEGKDYTVAAKRDGSWGCSCPRWIFARADLPGGHCKHIDLVLGAIIGNHVGAREPDEVEDRAAWEAILMGLLREVEGSPRKITAEPSPAPASKPDDLVLVRQVRTRAMALEI